MIFHTILGQILEIKPDIIFTVHGFNMSGWLHQQIRELCSLWGGVYILLATESPFSKKEEEAIAPYFDFVYTTDRTGTQYLPLSSHIGHSYDNTIHGPKNFSKIYNHYKADVAFVGSYFKERVDTVKRLLDIKDITYFFAGVYNEDASYVDEVFKANVKNMMFGNPELATMYSGAKMSLNLLRQSETMVEGEENQGTFQESLTIRMVEIMASGGVLLTHEVPELQEKFIEGTHYIGFSTEEELINKVLFYKDKDNLIENIRINAANRVREVVNSYSKNAAYILEQVEEQALV